MCLVSISRLIQDQGFKPEDVLIGHVDGMGRSLKACFLYHPSHMELSGLSHAHQYIFIDVKHWSFSCKPVRSPHPPYGPYQRWRPCSAVRVAQLWQRARLNRKGPTSVDTQSTETCTHMIGNRRLPLIPGVLGIGQAINVVVPNLMTTLFAVI